MFSARDRASRSFRAVAVAIAACSILLAPAGIGRAQEASSEVEISISVLPSAVTPVPTTTPQSGEPPAPGLPGTVSSRIVLLNQPAGRSEALAIAFIVVRDDRGSAAGWDVSLARGGSADLFELLENRDATIVRVLPGDGRFSDQVQGITTGRTLGPLTGSIPLLHASPGSGSGLFLQQLVFLVPGVDMAMAKSTIYVQLPFAP